MISEYAEIDTLMDFQLFTWEFHLHTRFQLNSYNYAKLLSKHLVFTFFQKLEIRLRTWHDGKSKAGWRSETTSELHSCHGTPII